MPADGYKLLADAHDYLLTVVRNVPADAWGAPTPCVDWSARQVFHHARLDQQALTMQITGVAPAGDPFEPVDALEGEPVAELEAVLTAAMAAWESGRDQETVPTPMGPMPAQAATAVAALDAAVHAWDIAVATGQDRPLPESVAEGLEEIAAFFVPMVRDNFGKFGPEVASADGASRAERLLAFSGRDPKWAQAG